ncbi:MAG: response regulator [Proteobacteria bacterium]|nr:response regulator [Pseudomonadota bacterium]
MDENLNIIIVDDEKPILHVFKEYLKTTTGYQVFTESNGLHALDIIKREKIDCCFLDISMPIIDGVKLAEQIHQYDKTIPIIMMTGNPSMDVAIQTIKTGVVDFLTKPIDMFQIPLIIQRVMRERSLFVDSLLLKEANQKNHDLLKINQELEQKLKDVEIISLILQKLEQATTIKNLIDTLVNLAGEITLCDESYFCNFAHNCADPSILAVFSRSSDRSGTGAEKIISQNIKKVVDDGIPLIINGNGNKGGTMAIPLIIKSNVFGVLVLFINDNARNFSKKDLYFMNFLLKKASSLVENLALYENIFENLVSSLYAFVETIEARDPYTKQHSHRVSLYAVSIADIMGCTQEETDKLNVSSLLHDIGKIGTPDHILLKPGGLSDEEFNIIKKHPITGSNIIGHLGMWIDEQTIIRHHHERFDGTGYPDGLKGEEIPMLSRILSIADVYDALTSDRSYRKKMQEDDVLNIIRKNSGTQFDPEVVNAFFDSYKQNKIRRLSATLSPSPQHVNVTLINACHEDLLPLPISYVE